MSEAILVNEILSLSPRRGYSSTVSCERGAFCPAPTPGICRLPTWPPFRDTSLFPPVQLSTACAVSEFPDWMHISLERSWYLQGLWARNENLACGSQPQGGFRLSSGTRKTAPHQTQRPRDTLWWGSQHPCHIPGLEGGGFPWSPVIVSDCKVKAIRKPKGSPAQWLLQGLPSGHQNKAEAGALVD